MRQLYKQPRRLHCVEPKIAADVFVVVFRLHAVIADFADFGRKRRVVCDDHAAVAETAQIFRREETQSRAISETADFDAVLFRSDCLRAVFYDRKAASFGNVANGFHVGALPV